MKAELTYTDIPHSYLHCMSTHCPQANTCLRAMAWALLPKNKLQVQVLNPARITESTDCPHYRSSAPVRYAIGFTGMQKQMYPGQYDKFSMILQVQFGRNPYFERRKGQRLLPPKEQEMVRQALVRAGVTLDLDFDGYKEDYLW